MNGDQHRRNRRIVKEPFGLRAISNYGGTITRLTDELLATWRPGEVRDIAEEMRQYMLRVTSTMLFGMDDPEAACRLGDMIARWVALNHQVGVGALVPNERFTHGYEQLLSFADDLEAEVMGMIRRRRESRFPKTCSRLSFPEIARRTWRNGNRACGSNGRFRDRVQTD